MHGMGGIKMVVSAEKILKKVTTEEKQKISKLEKEIDRVLESEFVSGRGSVCYTIPENLFIAISSPVISTIKKMYQEAGWKVTYVSDQRDGDYLHFVPAGSGV